MRSRIDAKPCSLDPLIQIESEDPIVGSNQPRTSINTPYVGCGHNPGPSVLYSLSVCHMSGKLCDMHLAAPPSMYFSFQNSKINLLNSLFLFILNDSPTFHLIATNKTKF